MAVVIVPVWDSLRVDAIEHHSENAIRPERRDTALYEIVRRDTRTDDKQNRFANARNELGIRKQSDGRRVEEHPIELRRGIIDSRFH